jgi:hypothetical protein
LTNDFHERGRICLPSEELRGREEVRIYIEGFLAARPELRAQITSVVDVHGAVFRVRTRLERPDGSTFGEYLDVGEVDGDGRITTIFVFREPLPLAE